MRFFKAFNILHRRTKSATFIPGPPIDHLAPNTRCSSTSYGQLPANQNDNVVPSSSIFDMVTSRIPSIHPQFNHLADSTMPSFWCPTRQSCRISMTSVQPSVDEEHFRLKEAVVFWSHEHSKLRTILHNCYADLVAEQQKNLALEHKAGLDAQIIKDLRRRLLELHNTFSGKTEFTPGDTPAPTEQDVHPVDLDIAISLANSETVPTISSPTKLPTIEEYSSALRLTLATRKELRDQKKVTKFWKRKASVTAENEQSLITPSVSIISSIRETFPAERQAALHALMMRRGLTSKLAELVKSPLTNDSCREVPPKLVVEPPLSFDEVLPTTASTLPPSFSKSSVDSRLPPLASESMKAEINLMFGSRDSLKLISPLSHKGRGRSGSTSTQEITKKPSPRKVLLLKPHHPSSTTTESFSSGLNTLPESITDADILVVKYAARQVNELDHYEANDQPFPQGQPSWSSSFIHISALPSGTSQTFGQEPPTSHPQNTNSTIPNPSVKQAGKECTSRRSWQHYTLTKSSESNREVGGAAESPAKQAIAKTGTKDKENNQFSKTLPVYQKGHSRLPVPSFTRN